MISAPLKVLIVDGDVAQGQMAALVLEHLNKGSIYRYQCECERIPALAMAKLSKGMYDVVILEADIQHASDGIRFAQLVMMQKRRRIPIIILTSRTDRETVQEALSAGVVGFIIKPYLPKLLLDRIEKIVRDSGGMAESDFARRIIDSLKAVTQIPTLAPIFAKMHELLSAPEPSVEEVSRVVEMDPATTMRLLRLANSAYFSFAKQVKTIRQAITLIGFRAVQNAVLAISTFEALGNEKDSAGLDKPGLWQHAIGTGHFVTALEEKFKIKDGSGFVGGLLHDVGKIVLDSFFSEYYAPVLATVREEDSSLLNAEQKGLGVTHAEVGAQLATLWSLPADLVEVIALHHQPLKANDKVYRTVAMVTLADFLCRTSEIGNAGDSITPSIDQEVLDLFQLRPDDINTFLPKVKEEVAVKSAAFWAAL